MKIMSRFHLISPSGELITIEQVRAFAGHCLFCNQFDEPIKSATTFALQYQKLKRLKQLLKQPGAFSRHGKCQGTESNRRHQHFQCCALPTELPWRAISMRHTITFPLSSVKTFVVAFFSSRTCRQSADYVVLVTLS